MTNRPSAGSPAVSERMSRQQTAGTAPELAVRHRLHAAGLRYRVDYPPIPGLRRRADIVFTRKKVAIFVDGCFWHSCPDHATFPKTNAQWWADKLGRNKRRDAETNRILNEAGWIVLRFWEHEDPEAVARSIIRVVRS